MTDAQMRVETLPKWAREYIRSVEYQRDEAWKALKNSIDGETQSPITFEKHVTQPNGAHETVRFNVQSHSVEVDYAGVFLRMLCRPDAVRSGDAIDLQWTISKAGVISTEDVIFQPRSFQSAYLFPPGRVR
jgi:hypothetical protein